jgi:TRAP-type C4-dicarboxylate transport system permease small subunit
VKKVYGYYCKIEEFFVGLGFFSIVALVFVSALARGLRHPVAWSIDIAQLLLAWVSFFGADCAFRHGQLLGIDLFTRNLPGKLQKLIELIILFLILTALIIFVIFGVMLARSNYSRSMQVIKLSYSFVTLSLPMASLAMSITVIRKIRERILKFNQDAHPASESLSENPAPVS